MKEPETAPQSGNRGEDCGRGLEELARRRHGGLKGRVQFIQNDEGCGSVFVVAGLIGHLLLQCASGLSSTDLLYRVAFARGVICILVLRTLL